MPDGMPAAEHPFGQWFTLRIRRLLHFFARARPLEHRGKESRSKTKAEDFKLSRRLLSLKSLPLTFRSPDIPGPAKKRIVKAAGGRLDQTSLAVSAGLGSAPSITKRKVSNTERNSDAGMFMIRSTIPPPLLQVMQSRTRKNT